VNTVAATAPPDLSTGLLRCRAGGLATGVDGRRAADHERARRRTRQDGDVASDPLLTPGVTAPLVDRDRSMVWVAVVHQAARESGGTVLGPAAEPGPGRNYYLMRVHGTEGGPLRVMLNAAARLVAAADDTDPGAVAAPFREVPRGDLFRLAGLRVAAPADMERPLTDELVAGFADGEAREVAHHRPARVGDILFNWFD
jgi:hypothetical protein